MLEKVSFYALQHLFDLIERHKESLDELSQLANTLFSPIPNRGQEPLPMINDHPFGTEEKGVSNFELVSWSFTSHYLHPDTRVCADGHGLSRAGNILPIGIPAPFLETQTNQFYLSFRWT